MADDSTDTIFGFILFVLFLALLGYAAGGGGFPSSRAGTTTAAPTITPGPYTSTSRSDTNIPGGRLKTCEGKVVANKTARSSNGSVNLKVYYTEKNDRNCAVATAVGWAPRTQGRLTVRLKFSDYDGTQWPEYAVAWSQPHTTQLGGVYLDDTYNRCVSASATYAPYTGMDRVTVNIGPHGCN
jgi:Flp pilus assembly protein TadG